MSKLFFFSSFIYIIFRFIYLHCTYVNKYSVHDSYEPDMQDTAGEAGASS